jgi:hypothetical protein
MSVEQTIVRSNVRGEPVQPFVSALTVARERLDGKEWATYKVGIVGGTVSGVDSGGRYRQHRYSHHRTVWEGSSLVMEEGTSSGQEPRRGDSTERREVWTLDDRGQLNVVITTRGSTTDTTRLTLVYRRE